MHEGGQYQGGQLQYQHQREELTKSKSRDSNEPVRAAIVGASGYGGGELLRLLSRHPGVALQTVVSETYAGRSVAHSFPGMAKRSELKFSTFGDGSEVASADIVFLAQENGKAMHSAPKLLDRGCKVIDLSADYRFTDVSTYREWYSMEHVSPQTNSEAVYGLPELNRRAISKARLVGNPGCYPTATILGLTPLLRAGFANLDSIVIDAKSGVSGAGRSKFALDFMYAEANESVSAYKIAGTHRHTPEIEQSLSLTADADIKVTFTPHLIPMTRGILATCYANLKRSVGFDELMAVYSEAYACEPFVFVRSEGLPATKHASGSNTCHIGFAIDERTSRVVIVSAIDNLIKGAAGQAIQNMNIICGFDETAGLDLGGSWP